MRSQLPASFANKACSSQAATNPNPTLFLSSSGDEPCSPGQMGHYLEGHSTSPRVMIPATRAFHQLHAQVPTASGLTAFAHYSCRTSIVGLGLRLYGDFHRLSKNLRLLIVSGSSELL